MTQILIVEDNEAILRSLELDLSLAGYQVATAMNGREALSLLEGSSDCPGLIISDINMPEMDGFTFYEAMRQKTEWLRIPFIFLTARDTEEDLDRGYGLGVDDYIVKPFHAEKLLRVVQSKLKRSEMLQAQFDEEKKSIEKAKQSLSQIVAHELRTPLVSINMVLDIISRQVDRLSPEQLQELLASLGAGSKRLSRLVEQMVVKTQLEAGVISSQTLREQGMPVRIYETLLSSVDLARKFAYRQPDGKVDLKAQDVQAEVWGSLYPLKHAFAEVIANGLLYSSTDVNITAYQAEGYMWMTVIDGGQGIEPEKLAHITEEFYQVDREKNEQQGIGLGLALAKGIIKAHGGTMELQSVVGKGTQVTIGLPLYR